MYNVYVGVYFGIGKYCQIVVDCIYYSGQCLGGGDGVIELFVVMI